jgi:inosose dehydratase
MGAKRGLSRRSFFEGSASATALALLAGGAAAPRSLAAEPSSGDPWLGLKVGVASYTFSKFPIDVAIAGIRRLGVSYVSIKDKHLPLKSTAEQRKAAVKAFQAAGLTPLSCGNVGMTDDEAQIRNAFEYARDGGIPTIVCSPTRASLPVLDKLVKEFDIKLAIHNHGPEDKVWPSPYDVWEGVQGYDKRIGLCIDVGHSARCPKVDPVAAIRKCAPRLYDVHIKDIAAAEGRSRPVELGRGVLDIPGILQALLDQKFPYHVGLEYEKDMGDPIPGCAESIGYIKGVLTGLKRA